ncbi:hypothetical protein SAMN05444377_10524 [Flavobacterium fontis]|jgi:hypothetical protein|uniref:Uncharacterized protein n=1 Tax=Flavobacterium fontis TaxID=1124188 RepID=A0A1M4ZU61_9FLAO|nr:MULTISPECIES: hypothetical protein [Flavobacterium]MCZ8145202.1 hypothetical protein [Flavobacterium sp.]MCZ8367178.1 hypothetical protein [Flavobacterium sp.]SHF21538.1 hypothetical protein SAMN05444377_10524 [Flavobacterium fontis]
MPRLIYDYTKSELERVSLSPERFKRKLKKAASNLLPYEIELLHKWLQFYTDNRPELRQCLTEVPLEQKGVC